LRAATSSYAGVHRAEGPGPDVDGEAVVGEDVT
jgi:hypothetical protein